MEVELSDITKTVNQTSLEENVSLTLFRNTAKSTFGDDAQISIWVNTIDILRSDISNIDKLIVAVIPEKRVDDLKEKTIMFREIINIDYDVDIRLTNKPLKIPMLEVWTSTQETDVWIDPKIVPCHKEATFFVPFDYDIVKQPIIFSNEQFNNKNIFKVGFEIASTYLPYVKWTVKPETIK